MNKMKYTVFFLLIFLFSGMGLMAQNNDFGVWTSLEAQKKIGKWNVSVESEYRLKKIASETDRWSVGLSGAYQVFKPIEVGIAYEFINFYDTEYLDFQPRHRASFFLAGKKKLGRFTISLREKIQFTAKDVSDRVKDNGAIDNYKVNPEYTWRNKFKIEYNLPRFPVDPAMSVESFFSLNNPDGNRFNQLRYTLSLNYKLSKQHKIELFGMYSDKSLGDDAAQRYVLGVAYRFKF